MAKLLSEILKGVKASTTEPLTTGSDPGVDYDPKSTGDRAFVRKHKVEKHADRVGNKNPDVTKKAPYKTADRSQYEETELSELTTKLLHRFIHKAENPIYSASYQGKTNTAKEKKHFEKASLARDKIRGDAKINATRHPNATAMDDAFDKIERTFSKKRMQADKKASDKHRAEDPGYNKYLNDRGYKNPYKKED